MIITSKNVSAYLPTTCTVATPSHSLGVVCSLHVVATVPPRLDEIHIKAGLTASAKPLCRCTAHVQHVNTNFFDSNKIFF